MLPITLRGIFFHWYRVKNEEGSGTKFQYSQQIFRLDKGVIEVMFQFVFLKMT